MVDFAATDSETVESKQRERRHGGNQDSAGVQVLAALRDLGCEVRLANGGEPLDVVVIDGSLVWCGDTAPLAYPRRDDCALRFVSREVAAELTEAIWNTGKRAGVGL